MTSDSAIALCEERGFAYYLAWGRIIRGWALVEAGGGAREVEQMRDGLAALKATGAALRLPYYLATLAEAIECADFIAIILHTDETEDEECSECHDEVGSKVEHDELECASCHTEKHEACMGDGGISEESFEICLSDC